MSVSSTDYSDRYETDGDDEFAITFPVQLDSSRNAKDIKVFYRNSAGVETDITSLCTIAGLIVTTPSAYAATTPASIITLIRWPALLQESTYARGSNFNAAQFEKDLDRIVYMLQRLDGDINRSFVTPITDDEVDLTIPAIEERPNTVLGFDADGLPICYAGVPAVPATDFMATVLDDTTADEAQATLGIKDLYQEQAEDKRELGELFFIAGNVKSPVAWSWANRRTFFAGKCLDTIAIYEDISSTNWPDLVTWLRAQKLIYLEGKTGEKYAFNVTNWAISTNVATLTFANTPGENAVLTALLEDKLVHGSYTAWRTITLGSSIGDITAGDYAITEVDPAAHTVKFAFTHANSSGSGSFTASFYQHRVSGSTTTARVFEATARTLVSAGDAENIAGLRRRDRFQGHWTRLKYNTLAYGGTPSIRNIYGGATEGTDDTGGANIPVADTLNGFGTPRTGITTDPRSAVGHLYLWGRSYAA